MVDTSKKAWIIEKPLSAMKSNPLKPEFIRLWRNKAAKKYHSEFAVLNIESSDSVGGDPE